MKKILLFLTVFLLVGVSINAQTDTEEVLSLAKYLNCDLFVIGGAKTYENFADAIDEWIVTEVPETVDNADTFMPRDFLRKFEIKETKELEKDLRVKIYNRI